ncbi:MAG: TIGR04283 family arsenosugar biosynthesis glycosyltransferase [Desulfobacterales bacterium]|nr:MAG: TIGR04283 family arsenosugar biosynthesis glycosyltransferase [Desulfobacterales bacterium]
MSAGACERLIIFTRYPEPGKTKTRLIPVLGEQGAAKLQRQMTEHLISKVRNLLKFRSLTIEIRYEEGNKSLMQNWLGPEFSYYPQQEGDIGQRMCFALDDAFQSGTKAAIIIGTDIPGITIDSLKNAFEKLKTNDLIFGPASDGGYYLIGIKEVSWSEANPQLFSGINWGTAEVLNQTLHLADKLGLGYSLLETLDDVDQPEDLYAWQQCAEAYPIPTSQKKISIIIPALNEADNIINTLSALKNRDEVEVILVDGGSCDDTADIARSSGAKVLTTTPSKARQMNAGAAAASGEILLFLHADNRLPKNFEKPILDKISQNGVAAGAFQLCIDSDGRGLRFIERVANWRSRHLQAPYGDQGIFVTKALFDEIGGYPDIPIMEDFELIRRLRRKGKIVILNEALKTSPRRWLNMGIFKTWLINQIIIIAYHFGASPESLAHWYRREKVKSKI